MGYYNHICDHHDYKSEKYIIVELQVLKNTTNIEPELYDYLALWMYTDR